MRIKARSKYHAKRVHLDGYLFDSQAEAKRYAELKLLERAGEISRLKVHPRTRVEINGTHICDVEADFGFYDEVKEITRYIDVKGMDLALSRLKRKLVKALYAMEIEVEKVKRGRSHP